MYVTGTLLLIPSAPKGRFYRIRTIPRQATGFPDTCRNPVVLVPGVESEFHRRSAVIGINFFSSGSGGLNLRVTPTPPARNIPAANKRATEAGRGVTPCPGSTAPAACNGITGDCALPRFRGAEEPRIVVARLRRLRLDLREFRVERVDQP